jgi:hypothetical protein
MSDNPRTPLANRLRAVGTRLQNLDPEAEETKRLRRRVRMVAWIALVIGIAVMGYGIYLLAPMATRAIH